PSAGSPTSRGRIATCSTSGQGIEPLLDFPAARPHLPLMRKGGAFSLAGLAGAALRPATEFGMLMGDPIFWGIGVPRGDGRPVMVLPGLFAGDAYLHPLRDWLGRAGYSPVRSGIDRNPGWSSELIEALSQIALDEHQRT